MVTTVIIGMLCVHLFCFCLMFFLISTRLNGKKMGMEVFAAGNLMLGLAYLLQLFGGTRHEELSSIVNHTLTLCAPVAYLLGAMRFFDRPVAVLRPLLTVAVGYSLAQLLVQWLIGVEARHAMLSAVCALLFSGMALIAFHGGRSFARDLRIEMWFFSLLIAGICVLNAVKFAMILDQGLAALDLGSNFQKVFYLYMSFLATVLPPSAVWLVLRRLTDRLHALAAHDPLTRLLNRRGLMDRLAQHFLARQATPAYLLIVDIDHFKRINDVYGHKIGDLVLRHIASVLRSTSRQGDLICRQGGEEFVVIALDTDRDGALQLAERIRQGIEDSNVPGTGLAQPIRCTATIGVAGDLNGEHSLDHCLQQADSALYRGKAAGRNRVEWAEPVREEQGSVSGQCGRQTGSA